MTHRISIALVLALFTIGCGSKSPAPATGPGTGTPAAAGTGTGKEGASCGDGTMGAPNIQCADGLVCDTSGGTAPKGPDGAEASAVPGTCKKK